MRSVWILGDQINRNIAHLRDETPTTARVVMIQSHNKLSSKKWHRQRAHLVITSMRRFALELRALGFEVDYVVADSFDAGMQQHLDRHDVSEVVACEPMSWTRNELFGRWSFDVPLRVVRSDQFITHYDEFAEWASGRKRLRMEDFYRTQRVKTGFLMDGDMPCGGQWNFDHDNRQGPPKGDQLWPQPVRWPLDDLDMEVLAALPETVWGDDPDGLWPTSRAHALAVLSHFIESVLPNFGPYEDAMMTSEWRLNHSLLSSSLNLGMLHPLEVARAADTAYREGKVPIASAEGFIRQVIGWREYVWGTYWLWMPEYRTANHFDAQREVPPVFTAKSSTKMACVASAIDGIQKRAYAHHIERLMVLGNLALLSGVNPAKLNDWFWRSFIDAAEWVMLPNVIGMSQHADGARMATKPYVSGGAYINKMSTHCKGCAYDSKKRVGDDACPFTTLYWDFIARHSDELIHNPRMSTQVRASQKLSDLPEVRQRAQVVLAQLDAGSL
jgi:deoxyribodipyrimidine photolyase-related protein